MAGNRIGRINEEVQRELVALIPTVKDPRVDSRGYNREEEAGLEQGQGEKAQLL